VTFEGVRLPKYVDGLLVETSVATREPEGIHLLRDGQDLRGKIFDGILDDLRISRCLLTVGTTAGLTGRGNQPQVAKSRSLPNR
jgi:hypothetical protein